LARWLTNQEQKLEITNAFWDAVGDDTPWSLLALGKDITFEYQDVKATVNTKMPNMSRRSRQDYIDLLEVRVVGEYRWQLTLKGKPQRSRKVD
jgi:hypothetical protein